jgi:hypothetical protein
VRYAHFGEGEYDKTERNIRLLLGERPGAPASARIHDQSPSGVITPESYLGYERLDRFVGSKIYPDKLARYELAKALGLSNLSYGGHWRIEKERIVAGRDARLRLRFYARNVYLVLGGKGTVRVLEEGKPVKTVSVTADRLYTLVEGKFRDATLELRFSPGGEGYAFTVG